MCVCVCVCFGANNNNQQKSYCCYHHPSHTHTHKHTTNTTKPHTHTHTVTHTCVCGLDIEFFFFFFPPQNNNNNKKLCVVLCVLYVSKQPCVQTQMTLKFASKSFFFLVLKHKNKQNTWEERERERETMCHCHHHHFFSLPPSILGRCRLKKDKCLGTPRCRPTKSFSSTRNRASQTMVSLMIMIHMCLTPMTTKRSMAEPKRMLMMNYHHHCH